MRTLKIWKFLKKPLKGASKGMWVSMLLFNKMAKYSSDGMAAFWLPEKIRAPLGKMVTQLIERNADYGTKFNIQSNLMFH